MNTDRNKLITWATIGVLAYILSDFIHEVIGHGGTCFLIGNRITLLTSAYFKSQPGNIFVDMGGPIANLVFAILTFIILKKTKGKFKILLLVHVLIYNLFWFTGTILHSSISKTGDWTFAVKELNVGYEKYVLAVTGFILYAFVIRFLSTHLRQIISENELTKRDFVYPFLFASISAFIAGLFFTSDRLHSGLDNLLEMAASIPILFLRLNFPQTAGNFKPNYIYSLITCVLYIIFCLTLGRGMTFLE